jgi:NADH:ubiquinone reductase (H+-translocating)
VKASDRVLPTYPPDLSERAAEALRRLKVVIQTGTMVTGVSEDSVDLKTASGTETIPARTALSPAGVQASRLGKGPGRRDRRRD